MAKKQKSSVFLTDTVRYCRKVVLVHASECVLGVKEKLLHSSTLF